MAPPSQKQALTNNTNEYIQPLSQQIPPPYLHHLTGKRYPSLIHYHQYQMQDQAYLFL